MSQDDCAVIDAGRVEVVGPSPAGQGGLVLLCATVILFALFHYLFLYQFNFISQSLFYLI